MWFIPQPRNPYPRGLLHPASTHPLHLWRDHLHGYRSGCASKSLDRDLSESANLSRPLRWLVRPVEALAFLSAHHQSTHDRKLDRYYALRAPRPTIHV